MYNQFCTTLLTIIFFLSLLDKNNGVRKKKRENKNTCEYEREGCHKNCQKIDVQISFLFEIFGYEFKSVYILDIPYQTYCLLQGRLSLLTMIITRKLLVSTTQSNTKMHDTGTSHE